MIINHNVGITESKTINTYIVHAHQEKIICSVHVHNVFVLILVFSLRSFLLLYRESRPDEVKWVRCSN